MQTINLDAEYNCNWIKNQIKWVEYNYRYLFKNIQQRKHELYDIILIEMSIIPFIETPATTAYSHSQKAHSQDVRKDVRYQSVNQLVINQSVNQSINQINQISQLVDQTASVIQTPAPVIQISLRQTSLQSLYPQLSYNSLYATINQSYHLYNRSPYVYASINQYALFESPRSLYVSNQIRFIPQVS
jgi:hypothetical protein